MGTNTSKNQYATLSEDTVETALRVMKHADFRVRPDCRVSYLQHWPERMVLHVTNVEIVIVPGCHLDEKMAVVLSGEIVARISYFHIMSWSHDHRHIELTMDINVYEHPKLSFLTKQGRQISATLAHAASEIKQLIQERKSSI